MTIYKNGGRFFAYDFRVNGQRYTGSTQTDDLDAAKDIEKTIRESAVGISSFCRSIIRKARRNLPATTTASSGYVYMLRSGYFIKIGHSTEPRQRIKAILTSLPMDAELLFHIRGTLKVERALHKEFAACHYQREWFFLCGKLKRFVEEFEDHDGPTVTPSPTRSTTRAGHALANN